MNARARILNRVRSANGAAGAAAETREAAVAAWVAARGGGPVPRQGNSHGQQRLTLFMQKLEAAAATVGRVSSRAELPRVLAHELRKRNLPASVRLGSDPIFAGLDWGTLETSHGVGRRAEPVTLSRAEFGLAETGTLVLASGPDNPVTLTFLGETHFVVLRTTTICGGFEDFWSSWRARGLDPRTINMVTGPSRSADIGQVLQLGAHGPVALHVLLLDE